MASAQTRIAPYECFDLYFKGEKTEVEEPDSTVKLLKKKLKRKKISGRKMIADALRELLAEKEFNSITTAEIANRSGRNESLIYRYFGDKRGLLHEILADYLREFEEKIIYYSSKEKSSIELLKNLIEECLEHYNTNFVFARVLFVESRTFPGFYDSETYTLVKKFSRLLSAIITKGVRAGEIRDDIPVEKIRDVILGSIEHFSLPVALFGKKINPERDARFLSNIVIDGIKDRKRLCYSDN